MKCKRALGRTEVFVNVCFDFNGLPSLLLLAAFQASKTRTTLSVNRAFFIVFFSSFFCLFVAGLWSTYDGDDNNDDDVDDDDDDDDDDDVLSRGPVACKNCFLNFISMY
uniref:Transmembrane protein n=1 Tax=Glossina pallidipes TaxID=7398 RepID=A0A1A9Z1N8_GLOPL